MKIFFTCITILLLGFKSSAQFSVGANLGTMKILNSAYDGLLFGGNLTGKYGINKKMNVGINLGYSTKSYYGERLFIQPITGLFEYNFSQNKISPYAGVDLGLYRYGYNYSGYTYAESYFGFALCGGANYSISEKLKLNSNLTFNYILSSWESLPMLGINVGVIYCF
jgi:hypothetical protein